MNGYTRYQMAAIAESTTGKKTCYHSTAFWVLLYTPSNEHIVHNNSNE
jgi:hypothetical protein